MRAKSDPSNVRTIAEGNGQPKVKAGTKEAAARAKRASGASGLTPAERRLLDEEREAKAEVRKIERLPESERQRIVAESEAEGAKAARDIMGARAPRRPAKAAEAKADKKGPKVAEGPKGTILAVPTPAGLADEEAPTALRDLSEAEKVEKASLVESGHEALRQTRESGAVFGAVLWDIKERGLYQDTHTSFHAFAAEVFGIEKRSVRYIIGHAKAVERLRLEGAELLPESRHVGRPLLTVYPEDQGGVWARAIKLAKAEGTTPKQRHVIQAAEESGKKRPGRPPGTPNNPKVTASANGPVEDERITSARLAGTIPEGAEVITTAIGGGPEAETIPLTDEEYLDQFPIRDKLKVATRRVFDVSALGYRDIADARVAFIRDYLSPAIKRAEATAKEAGPYLGLLRWVLKKGSPSEWVLCESCKGTGEIPKAGGECPDCRRAGFHVR